jgi:glutamine synthetase adenylyltransferase
LLQSTAYLRAYFGEESQGWEAAALLKARAVAGNLAFGERVLEEIRALLVKRYAGDDGAAQLAQQLAHTRHRMENEIHAHPTRAGLRSEAFLPGVEPVDFKNVRGGYYDIDYVIAFLLLTGTSGAHAGAPLQLPTLTRPLPLLDPAQVLAGVPRSVWQTLCSTAVLYRCLDHAARLMTGQPVLSFQRTWKEVLPGGLVWDLPRRHEMHRLLENWGVPMSAGLEAALDTARERVRELYDRTVVAKTTRESSA